MSPSLTVTSLFPRKAVCFIPMISIAVFVLLCSPFLASAWKTQINELHDGDTIKLYRKGRDVDIRFYGIDCPEKDQPYGLKAKRYVSRMCEGRTVNVEPSGQDRYGRVIGLVYVDGKLLNEALVMKGLAWVYDRYCDKRICGKWNRLEKQARGANVGLWEKANPIPLWEWRHGGKSRHSRSGVRNRDCSDFSTSTSTEIF